MPIDGLEQEMLQGFISEMCEIMETLDDDLVTLEKEPDNIELLNQTFRHVHNVKGASAIMGFETLIRVTHEAESVLNRLRKGDFPVGPEVMDTILEATNLIKLLINDIKNGTHEDREIENTIARLKPFITMSVTKVDVVEVVDEPEKETYLSPVASLVEESTHPSSLCRENNIEEIQTATKQTALIPAKPPKPPTPKPATSKVLNSSAQTAGSKEPLADNTTVRVDVKRLDDLLNQVGELVLERNRMMQLNQDCQHNESSAHIFGEEFGKLTKRMSFVTSELQMQVLKMRMMPVGSVFKKFPRIVRNISRDLGKDVDLQIFGEETELDRSVVDEIGDPLIHLIRNALDHGLETPQEREAIGKPRIGTLRLSAVHEGNQIIISIKDDGRGIDTERVGKKAIEKGLISEEQLSSMSQREMFDLIFLPGFSTKDVASDLSGRGVGMDVVKTNIKKLNGLIEIKSEQGKGSEFILHLPLTLAIIQSLLVEVEGEVYSIPLSSVLETLRVDQREFHVIGGKEVLKLRTRVLPLIRIQKVFSVVQKQDSEDFCYVVVIGTGDKRTGLVVSRLVGQQEVAIKSLGTYLADIPGIAGSTILGDGRVALIIDPVALSDR